MTNNYGPSIDKQTQAFYSSLPFFQFVELKGAIFKKFDKNNLFQVSCSDVRERFHLFALLFVVVVQTMKEYGWKEGEGRRVPFSAPFLVEG